MRGMDGNSVGVSLDANAEFAIHQQFNDAGKGLLGLGLDLRRTTGKKPNLALADHQAIWRRTQGKFAPGNLRRQGFFQFLT